MLELVEDWLVLLMLVLLIELDVELSEVLALVLELDVLLMELLVELVDIVVILALSEVLDVDAERLVELADVEEVEIDEEVEDIEEEVVEMLEVEVVVPVGDNNSVTIPAAHWPETLELMVLVWMPLVVTNRSCITTDTLRGALTEVRLTKPPEGVNVAPVAIRPAPMSNSDDCTVGLVLPEDKAVELPVLLAFLSSILMFELTVP